MFNRKKADERFIVGKKEVHEIGPDSWIITDSETGVQYLYAKFFDAGGLTLLVDENGKPLVDKTAINAND